jgi:hypothetical protein
VATFRRRAAAYGLDGVLVLIVYSVLAGTLIPTDPSGALPSERLSMIAGLLGGIVQAVYFVGCWSIWRRTLGQAAFGLQVGSEEGGTRLGPIDSLVRWAVLQGPLALTLAAPYALRTVVLFLAAGWAGVLIYTSRGDPDGRGYHDRIARSLVVEDA